MTTLDEYRRALDAALREYETLGLQRAAIDERLATLAQTVGTLMRLCNLAPTLSFGLTDACRIVLKAAGHPLTQGVAPFTATDEHYFIDMAAGPADVFLTGASRHGTLPAGWARTEGQGRVCVLTPGHNLDVWLDPNFQRLLANGLNWCAGAV
jgi:trehalose utilization protein